MLPGYVILQVTTERRTLLAALSSGRTAYKEWAWARSVRWLRHADWVGHGGAFTAMQGSNRLGAEAHAGQSTYSHPRTRLPRPAATPGPRRTILLGFTPGRAAGPSMLRSSRRQDQNPR